MVVTATAGVLGSLKAAYDIAKGINALNVSIEVQQAVAETLGLLVDARSQALNSQEEEQSLLQRVRDLEAEVNRLKTWDRENERYELKRYYPGVLAYALKEAVRGDEPPQRFCYGCYQKTQKGLLQAQPEVERGYRVHECSICKTRVALGPDMPADADR